MQIRRDYARRIRMQARWTKARKREASLSKRVATLRNSLSLRKKVSTRWRSLYQQIEPPVLAKLGANALPNRPLGPRLRHDATSQIHFTLCYEIIIHRRKTIVNQNIYRTFVLRANPTSFLYSPALGCRIAVMPWFFCGHCRSLHHTPPIMTTRQTDGLDKG